MSKTVPVGPGNIPDTRGTGWTSRRPLLPWTILFTLFLAWGFLFSVISPAGGPSDENAHMQYVRFLANERRLPIWERIGGGEAGYESQHPPLYYAAAAVVYSLSAPLPENWRWYVVRWFSLALSGLLFWVARKFSLEYFKGRFVPAFFATAAFSLTPQTLYYVSYINPDILSVLMCSVALWMSLRLVRGTARPGDRALLSVAFGAGLLTKLTVLGTVPFLILAHFLDPQVEEDRKREQRLLRFFFTVLGGAVISGWWYFRASLLYGTPFIHTAGSLGSGIQLAHNMRVQLGGSFVWMLSRRVLKGSYMTTWVQVGWLPPGTLRMTLRTLLSGLILLSIAGAARAWLCRRGKPSAPDSMPLLCGVFLLSLFAAYQVHVWFVDYMFHPPGRYYLNGLLGLQALIVSGLSRTRGSTIWLLLWVLLFLTMDIVSARQIWTVLNPGFFPGWRMFQLPPQY